MADNLICYIFILDTCGLERKSSVEFWWPNIKLKCEIQSDMVTPYKVI